MQNRIFTWVFMGLVFLTACSDYMSEEWLNELPGFIIENDLATLQLWDLDNSPLSKKDYALKSQGTCLADSFQYPVPEVMYEPGSYAGRGFYLDGVHLGEDIKLDEGMGIRNVAKGWLRFYGPATGYGDLVAVVEHEFPEEIEFVTGRGERRRSKFLMSIYGHIRKGRLRGEDDLGLQVGQCIQAGAFLGFVNSDAYNGDGAEHLHLGFRVQSMKEAQSMDSAWFRGYDKNGRWVEYFTAPSRAIAANLQNYANWHPNGTLIKTRFDPRVYLLENGQKRWIQDETTFYRLKYNWDQVLDVSAGEMACYPSGKAIWENDYFDLFHPSGNLNMGENYPPVLYWLSPKASDQRFYFNSIYTLYSWGLRKSDDFIGDMFSNEGDELFLANQNSGYLPLRDGTLFILAGTDQLYVVSNNGYAFPFASWKMYFGLKYRQPVLVIPESLIQYLIKGYGPMIDEDDVLACQQINAMIN